MFEIKENLKELSRNEKGWTKNLTVTSWYGKNPKLDIRSWNEDMTRPGKGGITLTREEAVELKDILNELDL